MKNNYHYNLGNFFEEIALKNKNFTAIQNEKESVTYGELFQLVIKLSNKMISDKIQLGDTIAIGNTKKICSFAMMLACLRIGVSYVNIDTKAPLNRNQNIINICKPKKIFFDCKKNSKYIDQLCQITNSKSIEILAYEKLSKANLGINKVNQNFKNKFLVDSSTIAYIMFTSGSTGVPKGVAVTHQNILHFIAWGSNRFKIKNYDRFANLNPMYFDNSVFDFYISLFSGACILPVSRELLNKPLKLISYINKMKCTIWFSVPSLLIYLMTMKVLTLNNLACLRLIIFGGEGYPKIELLKLFNEFSSNAEIVNVYGPTECTCICSSHKLSKKDFQKLDGLPSLGKLNQNFDYLILNDDNKRSKFGELCLIGPNVSAGYFNDIVLTNKCFINIKDQSRFMKRMYKTGDLVKEISKNLYFIGRKDNQIQHLGYRIELEEIENYLVKLEKISQAAVLYIKNYTTHGKIIGFVSSLENLKQENIKKHLKKDLPDYMIPERILVFTKLPKTPNGKIDRKALSKNYQDLIKN